MRALPVAIRHRLVRNEVLTPVRAARICWGAGCRDPQRPAEVAAITWVVHASWRERLVHRMAWRLCTSYPRVTVLYVPDRAGAALEVAGGCEGPVLVSRAVLGRRRDWLDTLAAGLFTCEDVVAVSPSLVGADTDADGGGIRFGMRGDVPVPMAVSAPGRVPAVGGTCVLIRSGSEVIYEALPPTGAAWTLELGVHHARVGGRLLLVELEVAGPRAGVEEGLRPFLASHGPWLKRQVVAEALDRGSVWTCNEEAPVSAVEARALVATLERPDLTVRIAGRDRLGAVHTGDFQFADALMGELRGQGYAVELEVSGEPAPLSALCRQVCVELRGRQRPVQRPGQHNVLWVISHPESLTDDEIEAADLVLVASRRGAEQLHRRHGVPVRPLLQFTDPQRFFPEPDPHAVHDVLFVGNWRSQLRPSVWAAITSEHGVALYGDGWELIAPERTRGRWVDTEDLRRLYSSAAIVLNDHWDDMRTGGFISNRLFDALACEAFVLSDAVEGLDEDLSGVVSTFDGPEDLHRELDRWLSDPDGRKRRAREGRDHVLAHHTVDLRVRELVELLNESLRAAS